MKLSQDQFKQELRRMVASPAWADLPGWFMETMVRRCMRASDPLQASHKAAGDVAGCMAFVLAIENEVNGAGHHGDTGNILERIERATQEGANNAGGPYERASYRQRARSDATGGEPDKPGAGTASTG